MNMNAEAFALNDEVLESVNGGIDVVKMLENIGESTVEGAKTGAKIGIYGGPVFAFGGMGAGALMGAMNGVKDAARDCVKSLIG